MYALSTLARVVEVETRGRGKKASGGVRQLTPYALSGGGRVLPSLGGAGGCMRCHAFEAHQDSVARAGLEHRQAPQGRPAYLGAQVQDLLVACPHADVGAPRIAGGVEQDQV